MASETKKTGKISRKILAIVLIVIIVVVAIAAIALYLNGQKSTSTTTNLPAATLTIIGANGTSVTLNATQLAAMAQASGKGGEFKGSKGTFDYGTYAGVSIMTLLNEVGGMNSSQALNVTGADGWGEQFSYGLVTCNSADLTMYNPSTNATATPTNPVTMILAYTLNGTATNMNTYDNASSANNGAYLGIAFVGSDGLSTTAMYYCSYVVTLQVVNPPSTTTLSLPAATLTIIGASGTSVTLNATQLAAMTQTSGLGGEFKGSKGTFDYGTYAGVSIMTLLNEVGGMNSSQALNVTGADGWGEQFSYGLVTCNSADLTMYNPSTNATATPTNPVTMILAYTLNGTATNMNTYDNASSANNGAYLGIAFVGSDGLSTTAMYYCSYVVTLQVVDAQT